jgi:hypothetical protein
MFYCQHENAARKMFTKAVESLRSSIVLERMKRSRVFNNVASFCLEKAILLYQEWIGG